MKRHVQIRSFRELLIEDGTQEEQDQKVPVRIGVLGGSFDPIHEGHLMLARSAARKHSLHHMVFVPAFQNPLKEKAPTASRHRLNMIERAIESTPSYSVCSMEIERGDRSYTVDSLAQIRKDLTEVTQRPVELFWICGSDCIPSLHRWKDIDTIFQLAHFVVMSRDEVLTEASIRAAADPQLAASNVDDIIRYMVPDVLIDVSSTQVRDTLLQGTIPQQLLPLVVSEYILANSLYAVTSIHAQPIQQAKF